LLPERLGGDAVEIDQSAVDKVTAALVEVSNQLRVASFGHAGLSGMGSTVVLALISGQRMVVAHLGDSRAYLLHEHELRQLTTDHNLAQVLVDCHEITVEEAMHHPARAQLTRYVGMPEQALPESSICLISPGDRLLLCSDGLSSMVCNDQLRDILCKHNSPEQACQQLVDEANAAGGRDNITALVVTIGDAAHAGEPM
jgi:protein phosphatase